ncbi:uncharacterized protein [Asterias amurensis]|uniref:uncharacterized protein n=1 Tax=Asterias amurensis TaxID=7602 RepID=UPI003AB45B13
MLLTDEVYFPKVVALHIDNAHAVLHQDSMIMFSINRILNINWRDHYKQGGIRQSTAVRDSYAETPSVCRSLFTTDDQPISHLVFWNPPGGHPNRGRRKINYPDTITRDT